MNSLLRRVVITGVGAVTPLGGDTKSSWKNLIDGKSGASSITRFDANGFPCTIACEVPLGGGISSSDGPSRTSRRLHQTNWQRWACIAAGGGP